MAKAEVDGKTITSGPMMEQLSIFGEITDQAPAAPGTANIVVRLDDQIKVNLVPIKRAKTGDIVELRLEVGAIKVFKRRR